MLTRTNWNFLRTEAVSTPCGEALVFLVLGDWAAVYVPRCISDVMLFITCLDANWNLRTLLTLSGNFLLFGRFGMDLDAWNR